MVVSKMEITTKYKVILAITQSKTYHYLNLINFYEDFLKYIQTNIFIYI